MINQTFERQTVDVDYSNQVWQCHHSKLDILLVDQHGESVTFPYLTLIIDSYSRCIMGFHLGFDRPSSHSIVLALCHAILPKQYGEEYQLNREWVTYGVPEIICGDASRDFRSQRLGQICLQLGINFRLCDDHLSQGGFAERIFRKINTEFLAALPGYINFNIQAQSSLNTAEEKASLTLQELNLRLVRYIVDIYNQQLDATQGNQTRLQRWESELSAQPVIFNEQGLDIYFQN
ncbi:MAG: DDE-type integrase/transposase/recombinase [Nostoc sp. DedSLP03]|uniref:DDE-type integrase/transposase/recombinase n=1 Tax=Nostoc sp. DedSLP03 TaxID=3075400 RepID=UPI002AD22F2E|nr:DDE-type integrase/transposase/recombinase [Nostoc sp. DedSLP03]MDZ7969237.1 DDE-type integrase/transposase/recombinase [Nostoc sp. DedSLP03]